MKNIARIFTVLFTLAVMLTAASCGKTEPADINVAVIKGPSGVGMASLMDKNEDGGTLNNYTFSLAASPDEVSPKIITGEIDIAAVPTNLASVLSSKTNGNIKILAVSTLGVLHILENSDSVKSVADLKGKTIYTMGQGSNPEYILRYILEANGLDPDADVTIEFVATNDELVASLVTGKAKIAMVPEPAATTVLTKVDTLRRAIDVNEVWEEAAGSNSLMMGCVIVRADFLDKHEDAVKNFLKEYKESIEFCENIADTAKLCEKHGIIASTAIAEAAIPNCNVTYVDGKDMQTGLGSYYQILFDANPASIGGSIPGDDFYYLG